MAKVFKENNQFVLVYQEEKYLLPENYNLGEDEFFLDDDDFVFEGNIRVSVKLDGDIFTIRHANRPAGNVREHRQSNSSHGRGRNKRRSQQGKGAAHKGNKIPKNATAPYNFVRLPSVRHKALDSNNRDHSIFRNDLHHGYIDFDIKTLTPLMIRGENADFFQCKGNPTIPGASIRGMLSNIIEVLSAGVFWSFNDRRIYQRAMFPDGTSANIYYTEQRPDTKGGFLKFDRRTRTYYLRTSSEIRLYERETGRGYTPFTIRYNDRENLFEINSGWMNNKRKNWSIKTDVSFPEDAFSKSDEELEEIEIVRIPGRDIKDYEEDINRQLGSNNSKDRVVDPLILAKRISKSRSLDRFPDKAYAKYGIPVFYSTYEDSKGEVRYTFGHTKNYRIPYHKKISDHIYESLHNSDFVDFRKSLFGDEKESAGKLQFEDSFLLEHNDSDFMQPEVCKVLSTPKSSYYPGYLEQHPNGVRTKLKNLKHWGSDSKGSIRGYKFYHHINKDDFWIDKEIRLNPSHIKSYLKKTNASSSLKNTIFQDLNMRPDESKHFRINKAYSQLHSDTQKMIYELSFDDRFDLQQFSILKPIKRDRIFKGGKIRFSNLSKEELGLLILALELNGNASHRMGYAKPYGLGSIKIENLQLNLEDRQKRYQQVFTSDGQFETGMYDKDTIENIKEEAVKSCFKFYDCNTLEDFWKLPRLRDLLNILNWDPEKQSSSQWLEIVKYLNLKEFRDKPVLPTLDELDEKLNRFN